ncbi:MAG: amino acid racemase [Candidatus Bathyarchaeota archaeon]|nr:amino acid racemase [Candidatus Bathyarchaeota archaeon]
MRKDRWDLITEKIVKGMTHLHRGGADFGLIATNTMHAVFDEVQQRSPMPLISIVDATAEEIKKENLEVVGLLGTVFTMSGDFYKKKLLSYSIQTLVPETKDQEYVNHIIFEELVNGQIIQRSRKCFIRIIKNLEDRGAQGVILGCTEIPLLIREENIDVKLFNTTVIHAEKALNYAIGGK